MGKGNFFSGQPIFGQLLKHIPSTLICEVVRECDGDRYYKQFKTWDHLVTMLYAVFNHCSCLREVTTGLLAEENKIQHLGLKTHPRRSTISDANSHRNPEIFEKIYYGLVRMYRSFLSDSRPKSKANKVYLIDSTTISLFKEILKAAGRPKNDGRHKGGIKVHTLLHAASDTPVMINYTESAKNDSTFLKLAKLPVGSVVIFDKAYRNHSDYNRLTEEKITWVTRKRDNSVYQVTEARQVEGQQRLQGVLSDEFIQLGHTTNKRSIHVQARLIIYLDPVSGKVFEFVTNNRKLKPIVIANYYQQRWQIEIFFKRIKQNFPLQYFLGDSENAIQIQIWCALIADLLLRVVQKRAKSHMAFSNIVGLVRLHLMTYTLLSTFLKSPEKTLLAQIRKKRPTQPTLFGPT